MEEVKRLLVSIGLKEEEVEIYLVCLELGSASVLELSKRTKIPRATIYLILNSLLEKSLIAQTRVGKRKRFVSEEPDKLLDIVKTRQKKLRMAEENIQEQLPQLNALYNIKVKKPKLGYYEGILGVQKIYEDSLNCDEILVHCMTQQGIKVMRGYLEKYFKRVLRRGIRTRELVSDTDYDRDYQKNYATDLNQIICIPRKYLTNTDLMIFGDKISMITYKGGQPVGILIEDKELTKHERMHFEMIWTAAKANVL